MEIKTGNEFIRKVIKLILDEHPIVGNGPLVKQHHHKLVDFAYPHQIEQSWDLSIKKKGESDANLLNICRKIISQSIKTTHPNFYNQLYGGVEEYGLAGAWLTDALNTSAATWEISPIFSVMEKRLIEYLGGLIGYDQRSVDGMFCPGGSIANIYGMILGRHQAFPSVKQSGVRSCGGEIVMFASEDSHYSFVKGAIWLGHGSDSVVKVKCDSLGRMIPEELERSIELAVGAGRIPFMVSATSGTTVLGAFDPLPAIGQICRKYGLWFHVDAALGGTCLFSRRHRALLSGIESADSVTWDLHKMACVPFQCTLILTRHPTLLTDANNLRAEYLFQCDKYYDSSYDSGDKSIQCGRKVDSLKLWLALKARGEDEMERVVDNVFEMADYVADRLRTTPGFELVLPRFESNNICFWYTPESMRSAKPLAKETVSKLAPEMKKRMMESGNMMISYQPLSTKGLPNFFRLTLSCFPESTREDMNSVISEFERLGRQLSDSSLIESRLLL